MQKWRTSDLSLECEWRASEEYPVAAIAVTPEGDGVVFTANCDGEIKEWNARDGGFRQMTVLAVRKKKILLCESKSQFEFEQ